MRVRFSSRWLSIRLQSPAWPKRFSVLSLLWLVLLLAVAMGWWRDHREQQEAIARLRGELFQLTKADAAWGVEQLVGPPDTPSAGDRVTAWASATPDSQAEWIICDFARDVHPKEIEIHETYNPGALVKASIFDALGREVVVWQGTDPTKPGSGRGISRLPINTIWKTQRVKLYLDSVTVRGWNEIDAVALHGSEGPPQWTSHAKASSSYGGRDSGRPRPRSVYPMLGNRVMVIE